jgi:menaquinone reductase, multiheme cytochrome c subunit
MGSDPDEIKFVEEYYEKGIEVPWLVYQYQPDNVFFLPRRAQGR